MPVFPEKGLLKVVVLTKMVVGITVARDMGRLLHFLSFFRFYFYYKVNISYLH